MVPTACLNKLDIHYYLLLIFLMSTAIILTALGFEHIGGYVPCDLCLRQRWPYYIAIIFSLAMFILSAKTDVSTNVIKYSLLFLALLFLINAYLGIHHAGVEWGWWKGPSGCSGINIDRSDMGLSNLLTSLDNTKIVPCDEASWRLFGLSFAGYNAIASFGLLLFSLFAYKKSSLR